MSLTDSKQDNETGLYDLLENTESSSRSSSSSTRSCSTKSSRSSSTDDPLFKTELCRTWEVSRTCQYGGKCRFAHGGKELRPVARHPKYKTQHCKTFREKGHCPYGPRCKFIHNEIQDSMSAPGNLEGISMSPTSLSPSSSTITSASVSKTSSSLTPLPFAALSSNQQLSSDHLSSKLKQLNVGEDRLPSPRKYHSSSIDMNDSSKSPDNMSPFTQSPRSPEVERRMIHLNNGLRGHASINIPFETTVLPTITQSRKEKIPAKSRLPIFQDIGTSKNSPINSPDSFQGTQRSE